MPRMFVRRWWVSHGKDGFELAGWDMWIGYQVAEFAVEKFLAMLGHPCCGRGIGRIPGVDLAGYHMLNLPNRWWRHNREVIRLSITREQALIIQPNWSGETWTEDDEEETV